MVGARLVVNYGVFESAPRLPHSQLGFDSLERKNQNGNSHIIMGEGWVHGGYAYSPPLFSKLSDVGFIFFTTVHKCPDYLRSSNWIQSLENTTGRIPFTPPAPVEGQDQVGNAQQLGTGTVGQAGCFHHDWSWDPRPISYHLRPPCLPGEGVPSAPPPPCEALVCGSQ